jgi:hypothetical protein
MTGVLSPAPTHFVSGSRKFESEIANDMVMSVRLLNEAAI